MTRDSKESVLSRWSRRKLEADQALPPVGPAMPSEIEVEQSAIEAEAEVKPLLTDADMPAIESLTEDSDFSGFMSRGVSDELRNLALRKLFRAPVFNIRDGLDEYDEDYTSFEKLGDIVTADMRHRIEMQEQKLREKLAAESEAEATAAEAEAADAEAEAADAEAGLDVPQDEDIDLEKEVDPPIETVAAATAETSPDQETKNEQ